MHVTRQKKNNNNNNSRLHQDALISGFLIEKHTSVLKSGIKHWITNPTKTTAVNIIAFDNYCGVFSFLHKAGMTVG